MVPSICNMWYYTILRLVNSEGNGIFWSILAIYSDYNHKNVYKYIHIYILVRQKILHVTGIILRWKFLTTRLGVLKGDS